ncbi:Fe(3+)-hydroxamate ABC transporter permease FhuB [Shewanella intestini]|uniref:Fe(3+)-hydroxamate ABC transporter permease FhuB n=1 Tax=Shewanella intestini TaxID=2017544 RepID=A0ABS5I062_9GAMM|nr:MULTISPECIES: Fe(3+)-hydroxamate ABC transporter permease FhuB [Shewanella]MBR9727418.1 Fe(3+)-hydroxamate ABC transporter permease FhuB [Shewanella intestini]MRG35532.1 Fe(3+)-hydroxamate ABC transporter permease FhuB [Shewanella sp. XMDDZSB0408]
MNKTKFGYISALLIGAILLHLHLSSDLSLLAQWHLVMGEPATEFSQVAFLYAHLPRLVIAMLVGSMLGMVGSLMQQLTQNPLTSPLTLGTSSGAWLALIIVSVAFPAQLAQYGVVAAMAGALLALALVIMIAGPRNMTGLPLVLSGMVVNILLGAIATSIILLNDQFAKSVFIWGAGDLAQNGWHWVQWLLPKLVIAIPILLFAPKVLTLLCLGQEGAKARGLNVIPVFIGLMVAGLWLVSASITAVGVISFIGLLTPNLTRALGARTPRQELFASLLLGAALLVLTDCAAIALSHITVDTIPSGIMAAAIGAPALLVFSRRKVKAQDQLSITLPPANPKMTPIALPMMLGLTLLMIAISLICSRYAGHWQFAIPDAFELSLRWPRLVTAICAGAGLAVAGTILQRLVFNPLASPDILGISAGATFALVAGAIISGGALLLSGTGLAFAGSMTVLVLILLLGKRQHYDASSLVLTGLAITAMIEALVQFALAKGTEDSYTIVSWLSGSTYRVSGDSAINLLMGTTMLIVAAFACHRWLTLLSGGRQFAAARGLNVPLTYLVLLTVVALLCALVTATMGPVSFVGLLAPHMAVMLGAKKVVPQLRLAILIGALLMLSADWLGQVILAPQQIAAGTLVSIIGGSYFLFLLIRGRSHT